MSRLVIHMLNPWKYRREQASARVAALRARDGEACARCRRPIRFDLPTGHEAGVVVEQLSPGGDGLDNLRLCHPRCNPSGVDHTDEVTERARRKNEAALFAGARRRRKQAA